MATGFSALLMAVQSGLLLGMFSFTSLPVDHSRAHVWVGGKNVASVDRGHTIPESYLAHFAVEPEVEGCEIFIQGFAYWLKREGGIDLSMVIGTRLGEGSLGALRELTPELRYHLTEPGAIVVDESEIARLGVGGIDDTAEIAGHRVRVVGLVRGARGMFCSYVYCSIRTARTLLSMPDEQTILLIARCRNPADAPALASRLDASPILSPSTSEDLSLRTRLHWLLRTRAGMGLGYAVALGLVIGAAVSSQTLYAATVVSLRAYTVLWALGIPRWRMVTSILAQSF
jgi:putative ABC transport system permease protein